MYGSNELNGAGMTTNIAIFISAGTSAAATAGGVYGFSYWINP